VRQSPLETTPAEENGGVFSIQKGAFCYKNDPSAKTGSGQASEAFKRKNETKRSAVLFSRGHR
jgi:hypothetical protein